MKKNVLFSLLIMIISVLFQSNTYVSADTNFARIINCTHLYKSTSGIDNINNIICLMEESYFVQIIGDYNEYYRVYYNGVNGYVKKNDVKEVSSTPSTPYPYNIKIIIGNNCNLRSSPTTKSETSNILATLYQGEENITFIGRVYSEEAIDFGGCTWYYVCYQGNYGYIYNKYIKTITPIYQNTESVIFSNTTEEITNPITSIPSLILIIILLIPCLAVITILYLPKKNHSKTKLRKSPKIFDKY